MADYKRFNTETLWKMFDRAKDNYYEIIRTPSNMGWGYDMSHNNLGSTAKFDRATAKLRAIKDELISRGESVERVV